MVLPYCTRDLALPLPPFPPSLSLSLRINDDMYLAGTCLLKRLLDFLEMKHTHDARHQWRHTATILCAFILSSVRAHTHTHATFTHIHAGVPLHVQSESTSQRSGKHNYHI